MSQQSRRRWTDSFVALASALVAVAACTTAGVPAASSPAPTAASAAAPTVAATAVTTAGPSMAAIASASSEPPSSPAAASAAPSVSSSGGGYSDGYGGYGGGAASTAPSASSATTAVGLATRKISAVGTVLVGPDGKTLYTYKPDIPGVSNCTGGCAQAWPPLTAMTAPAPPAGSTGKVTLISRSDGSKQVAYNGHPLYSYAGDAGPGDASGQGLGGVWFAAVP
jgi:predicted lipoprotein with Yx(FWY)xxD motif